MYMYNKYTVGCGNSTFFVAHPNEFTDLSLCPLWDLIPGYGSKIFHVRKPFTMLWYKGTGILVPFHNLFT